MVDVSGKPVTRGRRSARSRIRMKRETMERIRQGKVSKGDVLVVAQVAGIMAAKKTADLIPMCHPRSPEKRRYSLLRGRGRSAGGGGGGEDRATSHGVEMEALTAVGFPPSPFTTCARRSTGRWW